MMCIQRPERKRTESGRPRTRFAFRIVRVVASFAAAVTFVAPVTANAQTTKKITVRAKALWTDTGFDIRPDQTYAIYNASGTWSWYPGSYTGPGGSYHPGMAWDQWISNGMTGELIGCILPPGMSPFSLAQGDLSLFEVGAKSLEFSGLYGHLWLGFNDDCVSHNSGDNSGSVKVYVQRENSLYSLSFNPNPVEGGLPTTGTVTLRANAPAGGTEVYLTSSDTNQATVPVSVTIPAAQKSANFPVATNVIFADHSHVTIRGETGGDEKDEVENNLNLEGIDVTLHFEQDETKGGYRVFLKVELSKSPAKDVKILLHIDKPELGLFDGGVQDLQIPFAANDPNPEAEILIKTKVVAKEDGNKLTVTVKEKPAATDSIELKPFYVTDWLIEGEAFEDGVIVHSRTQATLNVLLDASAPPGEDITVLLKSSNPDPARTGLCRRSWRKWRKLHVG